ncbi:MAG: protein kinase, partial [Armatimonadetes bacterium]|nr:protein kinase [Anaerolineae bacterium]
MAVEITGQVIRGYELREQLGAGGMGAVYRAYQAAVGREVAVKVILPAFANQLEFIRRFETEAQLVARLEHPFIVPLFDYWRDLEGAYLVMRLFRGGSLRGALEDGKRYSPEATLQLLDQIAGALVVAHRNNVIHRDLKPDNILLDDDGNAFLTDFGIAKATAAKNTDGDDDEEEGLAGSPGYMSPEQITLSPVTPRTDIYSLGVILYELFTGTHPFSNSSTTELIVHHLNDPLPDLTLSAPEFPYALNEVIQRATAKDPDDRYPDVLTLAAALRQALQADDRISLDDVRFSTAEFELFAVNPYKGLRPFEEADAADFYGRETLVSLLLERLQATSAEARFLAVVGPSGSGKSSVVKAGVLPALRMGAIPGSERWFIAEFVPGTDPLQALEAALLSIAVTPPTSPLKQALRTQQRGLLDAAAQILPPDGELLLVIDQFEEVFTLLESEAERAHFLHLLRVAVITPGSRLRLIVTLRADFYDRPLNYEGFGALMRVRTEVVLPLSTEELERAISAPAERVGLWIEPALIAAVVGDVREEPGALPLLQYVLTEVYERRDGRTLTLAAYQASGGALGALARRADELYAQMDAPSQAITRQMFLRLVTLGEGAEDTRRRVLRSELTAITRDQALEDVLNLFGKYRLLSFDRDTKTREPTIEVAHEALIREWSRLREWLFSSRADVRTQRNLASSAGDWVANQRDDSYLLNGSRLTSFDEWATGTDLALTPLEHDYLNASRTHGEREKQAEIAQAAYEAQLQKQANQRLILLVAVLAAAFIGALVLSLFAFNQSQAAQDERNNAQTQVAIAATAAYDAQTQQSITEREAAIARSLALAASADQL